jgi:TIR domain
VDETTDSPEAARPQWDVFISHASEDKLVTDPLVKGLVARGLRVWYDRTELRIGDSLRRKIDEGLAKCRYGIVLLSHSFFAKDWPQIELDGLASREIGGQKVILPVWHGLTYPDVVAYSPSLAGRLAAKTVDGLDAVIDMVLLEVSSVREDPDTNDISKVPEIGGPGPVVQGLPTATESAEGAGGGGGVERKVQPSTVPAGEALDWRLDAEQFASTALEQLRQQDDIPLRLALDRMEVEAGALYSTGFTEELGTLLDRLTCLAAIFIRVRRDEWFDEIVHRLLAIYAIPTLPGPTVQEKQAALLWLAIAERIESIGGLAVRRRHWRAVQDLALLKTPGTRQHYPYLLRHVVVQSANLGLLQPKDQHRVSLVSLGLGVTDRLECVRPDLPKSDERILDSICQFDFLAALAAIADHGTVDPKVFYISFASYFAHRTEPIVERLLEDPDVRGRIFPGPDRDLADALQQLNRYGRSDGFQFNGWDGFESRRIIEFIQHHATDSSLT